MPVPAVSLTTTEPFLTTTSPVVPPSVRSFTVVVSLASGPFIVRLNRPESVLGLMSFISSTLPKSFLAITQSEGSEPGS